MPALVSTLCICIVFVPMFFLTGVARYLFVPLAEAVVFAMLASYLLSRTLVPTMAKYLLQGAPAGTRTSARGAPNPFVRLQRGFDEGFERLRGGYRALLERCVERRRVFGAVFLRACVASLAAASGGSARTSSRRSTAASSSCTCARRPARASRRRRALCDRVEQADPRG